MANGTSVMKEFHRLVRQAEKLFDGQVQLELNDEKSTNEVKFLLTITPNDGLYKNARCRYQVTVDNLAYPETPPSVKCLNNTYHPNIDIVDPEEDCDGSVCVNVLDCDWSADVGLEGCVQAVLFLFYNPQLDDNINPVCGRMEWSLFEKLLDISSTEGAEYYSVVFDKLIIGEDEFSATINGDKFNRTSVSDGAQSTNDNAIESITPKSGHLNVKSCESDQITLDESLEEKKYVFY